MKEEGRKGTMKEFMREKLLNSKLVMKDRKWIENGMSTKSMEDERSDVRGGEVEDGEGQ